jgi:hypothetical protein
MVSSTSAGRGAEAVKARLPLRAARWAGLFSDRINCCRSMLGACRRGDGTCCGWSFRAQIIRSTAMFERQDNHLIRFVASMIGQASERQRANKTLRLPTPSSPLHSLRAQFIVGTSSPPLDSPLLRVPEHDSPCEVAGAEEASDDILFLTNVATYCCRR